MKNSFGLLLFLLSMGVTAVSGEELSRISILSLLRPVKIVLTVQSQSSLLLLDDTETVSTAHLSNGSPFPVELRNNSLLIQSRSARKASVHCPGGCQLLIDIPGKINRYYHGDLDLY